MFESTYRLLFETTVFYACFSSTPPFLPDFDKNAAFSFSGSPGLMEIAAGYGFNLMQLDG